MLQHQEQVCSRQQASANVILGLLCPRSFTEHGGGQGPSMEEQLADFPRVREWMERVRDTLAPHYADVHAMLDKAARNAQRRKERAQAKL